MTRDLDSLEREAGIATGADQAAFWRQFNRLPPREMIAAGRAELERRALVIGGSTDTTERLAS